jgi:hypothetical protein
MYIETKRLGSVFTSVCEKGLPPRPFFETWTSLGGRYINIGRLEIVYDPPDWQARRQKELASHALKSS